MIKYTKVQGTGRCMRYSRLFYDEYVANTLLDPETFLIGNISGKKSKKIFADEIKARQA